MSSNSRPIQEMPPEGGYTKINYARVPARKLFTGAKLIAAFVAVQFGAIYIRGRVSGPIHKREELEMRSASIALLPFLLAEKERACLLQMRRNRDAEAELMKDVEGWEVGTWMGEPIYKTAKEDEWREPNGYEYFAHSDPEIRDTNIFAHFRR